MSEPFGAEMTADEVLEGIDLSGKRIFVTGVSSGLGVETARVLAARGATVVGAARDLEKARAATAGIVDGDLALVDLDLANLANAPFLEIFHTVVRALVANLRTVVSDVRPAQRRAAYRGHRHDADIMPLRI